MSYSPWGHKEWDMANIHTHTHTHTHISRTGLICLHSHFISISETTDSTLVHQTGTEQAICKNSSSLNMFKGIRNVLAVSINGV